MNDRFLQYLKSLRYPFQKISKLEFLQPNGEVAFSIGGEYRAGYNNTHDTRCFLQNGSLNVSLRNGQRRTAGIVLANIDDAFDYAVNKIWYGMQARLSMGLVLPNGEDFYLPQGVFYFSNPSKLRNPDSEQMTYTLMDKWSYLDGSLFGQYPNTMLVEEGKNFFQATQDLLHLSRYNMENQTEDPFEQIDNVSPVFTVFMFHFSVL